MTFHRSNTMRYITLAAGLAISGTAFGLALAGDGAGAPSQALAVQQKETSGQAMNVRELRARGPEGLRQILAAFDRNPGSVSGSDIDAVAQQHGATWSRLYWYTDMDAAKSAARSEHKPILYLRMLGKLTDEYSCANSRFFRTALYANTQVSNLLRDRFILVWQSERPVPVVSIDYGDGRVLKRTITGNSIHYVLDAEGNVVDALPGLYDPETFTLALADAIAAATDGSPASRRKHLEIESSILANRWLEASMNPGIAPEQTAATGVIVGAKKELEVPLVNLAAPDAREGATRGEAKFKVESPVVRTIVPASQPAPDAAQAAQRAAGKRMLEAPIVSRVMTPPPPPEPPTEQANPIALAGMPDADSPTWATLAARRTVTLDERSVSLIRSQNPKAYAAPDALARVVERFKRSIAADTVRNELLFRRQILEWLLASPGPIPLEQLNSRVYAQLFLTPRSDPWLGLVPDSTYSALTDDGLCAAK